MSLFGESSTDQRDFRMGLAGLLSGIHSLRILAERGLASPEDIRVSIMGIEDVLDMIPAHEMPQAQRQGLSDMLARIHAAAVVNFGKDT